MLYDKRWDKPQYKVRDALLAASAYIHRHGWCRGAPERPDGRVCIYGALARVVHDPETYQSIERLLEGHFGRPITNWNDSVCRSKEQVMSHLTYVADNLMNFTIGP